MNICENAGSSQKDALELGFRDPHRLAFGQCRGCCQALGLPDQASLSAELIFRHDRDFDPPLLDIENRVGIVTLREDDIMLRMG
jgi:hypothetical protein